MVVVLGSVGLGLVVRSWAFAPCLRPSRLGAEGLVLAIRLLYLGFGTRCPAAPRPPHPVFGRARVRAWPGTGVPWGLP